MLPRCAGQLVLAALLLAGCHTGSVNTLAGASVTTGLALGASAANRAAGGCYAICTNGTSCNPRTGLCEVLPCRGRCASDEHCEETFAETKCVPGGGTTGVTSMAKGKETKIPILPPIVPDSTGPPQIVPAAEQKPPADK
jgi:hypothetical protein